MQVLGELTRDKPYMSCISANDCQRYWRLGLIIVVLSSPGLGQGIEIECNTCTKEEKIKLHIFIYSFCIGESFYKEIRMTFH